MASMPIVKLISRHTGWPLYAKTEDNVLQGLEVVRVQNVIHRDPIGGSSWRRSMDLAAGPVVSSSASPPPM